MQETEEDSLSNATPTQNSSSIDVEEDTRTTAEILEE